MKLSENIRKYRLLRGMTQEQLAGKIGVSAQAISKWETSETYPDGSLLCCIADVLAVSLDTLFGRDTIDSDELMDHIHTSIRETAYQDRMRFLRTLCWEMERGLFGVQDRGADPNTERREASYILTDYGFTDISNGDAPFFTLFSEPEDGWKPYIGDGETQRKLFALLGNPDMMKAVLFLHTQKPRYLFESGVLARECGMDSASCETVLDQLQQLSVVARVLISIDGKERVLYRNQPSHKIIALLVYTKELLYKGGYSYQGMNRNEPLLKSESIVRNI